MNEHPDSFDGRAMAALDKLIVNKEELLEWAQEAAAALESDLERAREARSLLSDGDGSPPSPPPELKPSSDDDPPPAQQLPSQAPAEASSSPSSPDHAVNPLRLSGQELGARNRAAVLEAAREACAANGGSATGPEIYARVTLKRASATNALGRLVNDGSVLRHGKSRATRYSIPSTTTPATPPAERKAPGPLTGKDSTGGPRQEPTLQGRILSWLQLNSGSTAMQVATAMGTSAVLRELGTLTADGDIRIHRKAGKVVYVPVEV